MSSKYKFVEYDGVYFTTSILVGWVYLLTHEIIGAGQRYLPQYYLDKSHQNFAEKVTSRDRTEFCAYMVNSNQCHYG